MISFLHYIIILVFKVPRKLPGNVSENRFSSQLVGFMWLTRLEGFLLLELLSVKTNKNKKNQVNVVTV